MVENDLVGTLFHVAVFFIPFLFSICVHEFAHAWMAKKCGDRTPEFMGRLTLNPLAHADPIGTIVLPIMAVLMPPDVSRFIFGWAKPVPYDVRQLKDPKNGPFLIAAAGPVSNLILAFFGAFLFVLLSYGVIGSQMAAQQASLLRQIAIQFVGLNCMLAVLNLIPVHPLDGGKIVARFLPRNLAQWLEERENILSMVLLILFLGGLGRLLAVPASWIAEILSHFAERILQVIGVISL